MNNDPGQTRWTVAELKTVVNRTPVDIVLAVKGDRPLSLSVRDEVERALQKIRSSLMDDQ